MFHPHCHQRAEGPSSDGLPNGIHATIELLSSCGYNVELMDTGCCGMAGTFGYEAEHYELSMKVGELKLFPQVRDLTPSPPPDLSSALPKSKPKTINNKLISIFGFGEGARRAGGVDLGEVPATIVPETKWSGRAVGVVSSGAACRMQIQQGTGVNAIHPIVFVAKALKDDNLS
jgi:Fe-S oxidoreductase